MVARGRSSIASISSVERSRGGVSNWFSMGNNLGRSNLGCEMVDSVKNVG